MRPALCTLQNSLNSTRQWNMFSIQALPPTRSINWQNNMSGFGGMLTFALKGGLPAVEKFIARIKLFVLADSLGGVESLIASPAKMTLGPLSDEEKRRRKCTDNLVRLSIGLENAGDLEADLQNALSEG